MSVKIFRGIGPPSRQVTAAKAGGLATGLAAAAGVLACPPVAVGFTDCADELAGVVAGALTAVFTNRTFLVGAEAGPSVGLPKPKNIRVA